jgi:cellulose synthase/poly-beta-1,6-N-acetylglucosamine synthase-like glycosyltransferase
MVNCVGKDFSLRVHRNIQKLNSTGCPAVDILLPVCGEDFEVIHNTWTYVSALDWPTKTVYVLDDKKDDKVRDLAQRFGFTYITRKDNHMKKAGNLRNAFHKTTAPFFAIFDADFCPRSDYLKEIMPYFAHDGKIAIVQTPQFFEVRPDQTWVERAAGSVQELFYRFIQVSRDTFGGAVCVGTCAVYRREALVPFGGTAEIGFSEDVHTGFAVVDDGWKLKYIPLNLAKGVCPYELKSFFSQQYRWALGSTTLCTNPHFWKSNLSFRQKACFLSGMLYFQVTAFATVETAVEAMKASGLDGVNAHGTSWFFRETVGVSIPAEARAAVVQAAAAEGLGDFVTVNTTTLKSWLVERWREAGKPDGSVADGTAFAGLIREYRETRLGRTTRS